MEWCRNSEYNGDMMKALILIIAGEFGIVYRARLTRSTLRKTECETVAVKTIKGEDIIHQQHQHMHLPAIKTFSRFHSHIWSLCCCLMEALIHSEIHCYLHML